MILTVQRQVHDAISDAIRRLGVADVPPFTVEVPPTRALGDLAVPVAFQLARSLRKPPKAIAQDLAAALGAIPGVNRVAAAPNGYLNLYLDRAAFLVPRVRGLVPANAVTAEKTIVEHTAINPNKAAHIGHLRNAALGDTLARVLRFRGTPVEVQNYIDDLGVQVADIVVGFRELEHRDLAAVRLIADTARFDYYCWDLYSRVTQWYDEDRAHLEARAATLHALEDGGGDAAAIGAFVVDRVVRAHLATMSRLNIAYDLLTYEGDIVRLQFWARAFEVLKAQGAVYLQREGKLAGCWVMQIEDDGRPAADDGDAAETDKDDAREKVIVRSNGVVTYIGKDLANQFWKLGLLGRDFNYRLFGTQANGRPLWSTTSAASDPAAPPFGRAARIFNVIDSRQMYLQALLSQALRALGHPREAENSVHFSYEMVALSHATAREFGYRLDPDSEDARKPFVEVSGRKGLGVKIDDLLDVLTGKATAEVGSRNPEFTPDDCRKAGAQIAVAAIRYFMLKFSRGKLIVFDIEEALSFEGETGPYLQYAVVRATNILRKLEEREGISEAAVLESLDGLPPDELTAGDPGDPGTPDATADPGATAALWPLVFEASRLDDVVDQVVRSLEFSVLAKYAFGLAQLFNAFYHRYPILSEEDAARKRWRAAGVAYVRGQLTRALDLMGVEVPNRM
ncbi:MAG TPA: arginine--tRNA ligase [Vicinamibacterales bacterium]|nr:arginine--tRNA ligase [Vicinamibacterales bacterium]